MYWPAIDRSHIVLLCAATAGLVTAARWWRGSQRVSVQRGARIKRGCAARCHRAGRLSLAGVPVAGRDECKHFKLLGSTGSGKSNAIRGLLAGALARGDRAVIADPDATYLGSFYRRASGDVILNPFEPHSYKWDPFAEIAADYDADQLAQALIPNCQDPAAQEWRGYARIFVAATLRACARSACPDLNELWRVLTTSTSEELRALLADTPAQPFVDPENARMFGSIRAVTASAVAALEFVRRQRARPLSIRQWIQRGERSRILFMPYKASQIAALRGAIAAWMRLAIFEALSGTEGRDQHLWFVVDELDALGAIDGLKDALARLRKFGGRCVLGFQSISQVSGTYGSADAQTLVENCGNSLILRCSGSEQGGTSLFASRLIGEREVLRAQVSRGVDRDSVWSRAGSRRSRSITRQSVTEAAVLPSEIEQLPDLCGYLKTASSPHWLKIKWTHHARNK